MAFADGPSEGFRQKLMDLEVEVPALQQRLQEESGDGAGDFDSGALLARLEEGLAVERRSRAALTARMSTLEDSIRHERKSREAQLRNFSAELETTMRGLIGRIDTGLSIGAAAMRERTDATENRLRNLIQRVDGALSAGAAAAKAPTEANVRVGTSVTGEIASETATGKREAEQEETMSDQLVASFARIREQRQQLDERHKLGSGLNARGLDRTATPKFSLGVMDRFSPSLATPGSAQVPGSGLQSRIALPRAGAGSRAT